MIPFLLDAAKKLPPLKTAVVHPVTPHAIEAAVDAAQDGLITPVFVGPKARIQQAAQDGGFDITPFEIIPTEHSHEAADIAATIAGDKQVDALMKGSLHSDEFLSAIIRERKLKTERRLSHCYLMVTDHYPKPFLVTDAAINIAPDLHAKVDIVQNAIHLWRALFGVERLPKVALLAAVEMVNPAMQTTLDAAALCKMSDRGQIVGGILDGPLAFDNAINIGAAKEKGIVSNVAGDADILVAPDLEAANILGKSLTFIGGADAAGIVLGARVPVMLTSRADSVTARRLSCAVASLLANARCCGVFK